MAASVNREESFVNFHHDKPTFTTMVRARPIVDKARDDDDPRKKKKGGGRQAKHGGNKGMKVKMRKRC